MNSTKPTLPPLVLAVAVASGVFTTSAAAQEPARRGGSASLLEEVVVTARKREEGSQEVPMSIAAFNSDQIQALKVRDLTSLSVGMPNVALDDVGTTRGTQNFSIRGLGINSSIPSIDPTVGVFVNGVYLGVNNGIIFDVFDLESIEVLRGPQGILFGRNVTGGAILMNTKKPGEELEGTMRVATDGGGEGGMNYYAMGTVGGPVTDNLGLKLTAYYNEDEGYFENQFNGEDYGAVKQTMIRPTMVWNPTDLSELVVRYEYTDISGDGPVAQSHFNGRERNEGATPPASSTFFDRNSFGVSNDNMGSQDLEVNFLTLQYDQGVALGDGNITFIYGYRDSQAVADSDIDGQPFAAFHSDSWLDATQHSMELRYNGRFGNANVTTGAYWFDNDVAYHERRNLLGALTAQLTGGALGPDVPFQQQDGGGNYQVETLGLFAAVDYDLSDRLTLTAGLRVTEEKKSAEIATLALNTNVLNIPGTLGSGTLNYANPISGMDSRCNIVTRGDCPLDFNDDDSWTTWSPKLGLSYVLTDASRVYGHWSRGFRSGGYNLRNTSPVATPGPFDEEQVDSFEIGYKSTQSWGRLNAAMFYTMVDDMQREVNTASGESAVVQVIDNTADATLWGLEVDGSFRINDSLLLLASVGYLNAEYDDVRFDLNGDGDINAADKDLDLPRAPELTYSIGLNYDWNVGSWGYATARVSYAYRDSTFFTDDNRGLINEQDILDAGIDFYSNDDHWVFSLYGRNLLDTVKHGGATQLPQALGPLPLGGTFAPLAKGEVYGAEVTYNF
ncbi:TonB-dependent receptor [Chromatocurvus halotolerans]|uniref:Iron complex outermembrane receptor protein n=1 Tax=Chromatocurvus halotolerans TaxID=1132028 RepID=A0A4R2KTZ1_9GAMM|nr:TonB-dependent receptor [Chromatocurvus halotolerans]TCO77263.1 iron complex outermembrane receptor protein [Chromatocurvus halotolerans]